MKLNQRVEGSPQYDPKNRFTAKTFFKAAGFSSYKVITRPNPGFRDTAAHIETHLV